MPKEERQVLGRTQSRSPGLILRDRGIGLVYVCAWAFAHSFWISGVHARVLAANPNQLFESKCCSTITRLPLFAASRTAQVQSLDEIISEIDGGRRHDVKKSACALNNKIKVVQVLIEVTNLRIFPDFEFKVSMI